MDKRILKPIATIVLITALILSFSFILHKQEAYALVVVGEDYGLRAHVSDEEIPTNNLNPGDTKSSVMTISNTGEVTSSLPAFLKTQITKRDLGLGGGDLDDRLNLTIRDPDDNVLYDGPISGLDSALPLGDIIAGDPLDLTFLVHLPGAATGNAYQGASLHVKWTVITEYSPVNTPTPTPTDTSPPDKTEPPEETNPPERTEPPKKTVPPERTQPPEVTFQPTATVPSVVIEEEDIPGSEAEVSEISEVSLDDEQVPGGGGLPKTGEIAPILFYTLGLLFVGLGIYLRRRKKKSNPQ